MGIQDVTQVTLNLKEMFITLCLNLTKLRLRDE